MGMSSSLIHHLPRITIVVPSYNQGRFIEQTIVSILGQNYPNLELIVMDGGSTDETTEVVGRYAHAMAHFISEPDGGQANAINKGFRLATGDILAWLNSDDMYMPLTLARVVAALSDDQNPRLVYGGCLHFYQGKSTAFASLPPAFDREVLHYSDYIIQPSAFWTRSLWEAVGELNEAYHYVLDWEWFIRATKVCEFTPLPEYLSIYRQHDEHKTGTGGYERAREVLKIIERFAPEEWVPIYQDVFAHTAMMNWVYRRLASVRLHRLTRWFFPQLYMKYGLTRVDRARVVLGLVGRGDLSKP